MIKRSYSINRIMELRDEIVTCLQPLIGKTLSAVDFAECVDIFVSRLPEQLEPAVVRESLLHLAGVPLTLRTATENAWRLAGNIPRLSAFHPVPPWNRQATPESIPVQILGMKVVPRAQREFVELELRVLAGTSAPTLLYKVWSPKFLRMLAVPLGFSKPWGKYPFEQILQLVNLRFYAMVEPQFCGVRPGFEKIWMTEAGTRIQPFSCYQYNQQFIHARERTISDFDCPAELPKDFKCYKCVIGMDHCPLAVHTLTFEERECSRCHRIAWFDPALSHQLCIGCYTAQAKGNL